MIKKFYLNEKMNRFIVITVIYSIVVCGLTYFVHVNDNFLIVLELLGVIVTFTGVSLLNFLFDKKKKEGNIESKQLEEIQVNRKLRLAEITGKEGITLLTGASGIGKSCLLDQMKNFFDAKNISYFYKENNYFDDIDDEELEKKEYIILDQFERALWQKNIGRNIEVIKQFSNKKIIISVRREYLGEVYNLFDFDKKIHLVWLDYNESELIEIKKFLLKVACCSAEDLEDVENDSIYSKMFQDAKAEKVSLIQISNICKVIQHMEEEYVEEAWETYHNYDEIIKDYLKLQINNYKFADITYVILYLLCIDNRNEYINGPKDFQNVALCSQEDVEETVIFLKEQNWIKEVKDTQEKRSDWIEQYEISHDYFQLLLKDVCRRHLDNDIAKNIEAYNGECQNKRGKIEKSDSVKNRINKICKEFIEGENRKYLNWFLVVLICIVICENIRLLCSDGFVMSGKCWMLAGINLVVGESIYYIYNYYYQFMRIFKKRYVSGVIMGFFASIIPYTIMDYWSTLLGVEILVMGIIMGRIKKKVRENEKNFFQARYYIFSLIGIIVIVLGLFFPIYVGTDNKFISSFFLFRICKEDCSVFSTDRIWRSIPLFTLYAGYMAMGIIGHINRTYIHAMLGKVLYGGKGVDVK